MAGRAKAAPVLRKTNNQRTTPFKAARWSEFEDDNEKEYGEDEVTEILKKAGLPHMERSKFAPETPKPEIPEVPEPPDDIHEHGSSMAKADQGRGALPRRLNYRERSSHQVYEW